MRYRKLSPTGDYMFGNGQEDFYRDVPEAVGQSVLTRLLLWLGEWFLNTDEGTAYLQGILGKHSQEQANVTIQDRVTDTQGVVDFSNYQSQKVPVTRGFDVAFDIDTVYGPTSIQIANYANY